MGADCYGCGADLPYDLVCGECDGDGNRYKDQVAGLLTRLRAVEAENERLKNDLLDALDLKVGNGPTALSMLADARDQAEQRAVRLGETLGFIESAALFHPDAAWPDELKAQLRRIGKMAAHDAALTPPPPAPISTFLPTPPTWEMDQTTPAMDLLRAASSVERMARAGATQPAPREEG